jgi:hypothetical protein
VGKIFAEILAVKNVSNRHVEDQQINEKNITVEF